MYVCAPGCMAIFAVDFRKIYGNTPKGGTYFYDVTHRGIQNSYQFSGRISIRVLNFGIVDVQIYL